FGELGSGGLAVRRAQRAGGGPRRRARDGAGAVARAAALVRGEGGGRGGAVEVRAPRVQFVRRRAQGVVGGGLAVALVVEAAGALLGVQGAGRARRGRQRGQFGRRDGQRRLA